MKGTRDLSNVYSLLESQLGAKRIREVDHDDAYAMITVKGKKKTVFFLVHLGQVRNCYYLLSIMSVNCYISISVSNTTALYGSDFH